MPQQIDPMLIYFFVVLGIVFCLVSMYFGLKNYNKILTGAETGLRYSILSVGSFFLAGFISLTTKNGFSWITLCVLVIGAGLISFFLYINVLIRKKTVSFLRKKMLRHYSQN